MQLSLYFARRQADFGGMLGTMVASAWLLLLLSLLGPSQAFAPLRSPKHARTTTTPTSAPSGCANAVPVGRTTRLRLRMAMDPVTYLRTEWVSAALCTNQTPRSADVCLQLGCQDGRALSFIPRTIRELITSSVETDGKLTIQARRQLKQSQERRGAATVTYVDQRADDLRETADESVDVVISLQATERMMENNVDWKKSVQEAARVLKPGGRLLWVEPTDLKGESYIGYIEGLAEGSADDADPAAAEEEDGDSEEAVERFAIFDDVGYDSIDFILQPHTAGVAIKSMDAGMTQDERAAKTKAEEDEKMADLAFQAYERGSKKKRRKKKKKAAAAAAENDQSSA